MCTYVRSERTYVYATLAIEVNGGAVTNQLIIGPNKQDWAMPMVGSSNRIIILADHTTFPHCRSVLLRRIAFTIEWSASSWPM